MKSLRGLFLTAIFLGSAPAVARADSAFFEACRTAPVTASSANRALTQNFAAAMAAEFRKVAEASHLEIERSIKCLRTGDAAIDDCAQRLDYFENQLPNEWSIYRQTLAMTRFSAAALLAGETSPAYNHELSGSNLLWFSNPGVLEPLTPEEDARVGEEWETQLRRIRLALKKGIEQKIAEDVNSRRNLYGHSEMREALILFEQPSLQILARLPNPHIQGYFHHIQRMIFRLNQKRVIQQLGAHPLLGVLQKARLDRGEIIRGLEALRENLVSVEGEWQDMLKTGTHPQPAVSRRGSREMLDYLSVIETALFQRPDLCEIASELMTQKLRIGWIKNIGMFVTGGVLLFTAPIIAVPGFMVLQTYALTDAAFEAQGSAQRAFTNPVPELNFNSVQDAYVDDGRFGTEMILSPLAVTGVSIFKVSKLRGLFLP